MNKKIEHLKMIQGIITRMAGNLFLLKGWAITLIVALLAMIWKVDSVFILFSLCILLIFWILDGFFLSMERCFKKLYEEVSKINNEDDINFSMDYKKHKKGRNTWLRCIFSKTLLIFYIPLFTVLILTTVLSNIDSVKLDLEIDWQNKNSATTASKK